MHSLQLSFSWVCWRGIHRSMHPFKSSMFNMDTFLLSSGTTILFAPCHNWAPLSIRTNTAMPHSPPFLSSCWDVETKSLWFHSREPQNEIKNISFRFSSFCLHFLEGVGWGTGGSHWKSSPWMMQWLMQELVRCMSALASESSPLILCVVSCSLLLLMLIVNLGNLVAVIPGHDL